MNLYIVLSRYRTVEWAIQAHVRERECDYIMPIRVSESTSTTQTRQYRERDVHAPLIEKYKGKLRLRILISYWYYKDTDLDALFKKHFTKPYPDVFADSGAFSAATQGAPIKISEYRKWVERWKHLFSTYSNLDVIGDPDATLRNQRILERAGLEPLPVFHVNDDWKYLKHYIKNHQYIALGGMVPYSAAELTPWLIRCFKMADGRAVYHGFGLTKWSLMKALPWYSVDSSSWGQGFRYGSVPIFDPNKGAFVKADLGNRKRCAQHASLFRMYGFDWRDFADRKRNDRRKTAAIAGLSYMIAEQWLRERFSDVSGNKVHLVTAASTSNMSPGALAEAGLGKMHLAEAGVVRNFDHREAVQKCFLVSSKDPQAEEGLGIAHRRIPKQKRKKG